MEQDEVVIGIRIELEKAKTELRSFQKMLRTNFSDVMSRRVAEAQGNVQGLTRNLKDQTNVGKRWAKQLNYGASFFQDISVLQGKIDKQVSAKSKDRGFQGWALSLMFAGQIIKNTMMQIWASSTKTFQDVMHSTYGTVTAFDMLNGSLMYLGFNIGQALEPIAAMLAPLIEDIAEFVGEHPVATKWIFILVTAFGFLLTAFTGLVLAGAGVEGLLIRLGIISGPLAIKTGVLSGAYTALTTSISSAAASMWAFTTASAAAAAPWLILTGLIIAAVALGIYLGAVWKQVIEGWKLKIDYIALGWADFWIQLKKGAYDATTWITDKILHLVEALNSVAPSWAQIDTSAITEARDALKEVSDSTWDIRAEIARQQAAIKVQMTANETAGNANLMDTINNLKAMLGLTTNNISGSGLSSPTEGVVSQTVNNVTNNFVQQTGEDNASFINRIMAEINNQSTNRV